MCTHLGITRHSSIPMPTVFLYCISVYHYSPRLYTIGSKREGGGRGEERRRRRERRGGEEREEEEEEGVCSASV